MNICITGALGHIGSALIRDKFLSGFKRVYLIDNLLTQRYTSLFDLPEGINYHFSPIDILSEEIKPIIKDSDAVIHLAAVTDAEGSFYNTESIDKVNKKGLEYVARICAEYGRPLIFPSTTSVYGKQTEIVDESCPEEGLKPQSPYAESKLFAEKFLMSLSKDTGLKFVIFRLGTIFGYSIGMRFHTAVNKFIWQSSLGKEITVWKTALNQKRPYCDLKDCISGFSYVLEKNLFNGEIYNIVTTNLTVQDIIDAIEKYIPDIRIKFVDSPIMNQLSYNVSNKKSIASGFKYSGNLDDSIRRSVQKLRNITSSSPKVNL